MLEQYLVDLDRLRDDPASLPCERRALAVLDRESGSRWQTWLGYVAAIRSPVAAAVRSGTGRERPFVHVWSSAAPAMGERSAYSFPVDALAGDWSSDAYVAGVIVGHIAPGRAVGVRLDGRLFLPVGPLRPLVNGARWPSR